MPHVPLLKSGSAPSAAQEQLEQVQAAFGTVPALFQAVVNSPAALASMWGSFGALGSGALGPELGEQIAVAVANANSCEYCLAAHTALGRNAGLSTQTMANAQVGVSTDPRTQALLRFALDLVEKRGRLDAVDVEALREHGWDDEHIVETIAQVALNLFTNYINIALDVPLDFPRIALRPNS